MAPKPEDMGKVSRRARMIFALTSVLFVAVLAISPVKDLLREWRGYQRDYVRFAQTRPDTKSLLADYHEGIQQIWIPQMDVVDRCTTCHLGITQASLSGPNVPQPFRNHPLIPHPARDWGCVVCHRGQGLATEVDEAHETTLAWEKPMLPTHFIQASCGTCHKADIPQAPQLARGRDLLVDFNCIGCHRLSDVQAPAMLAPDLTSIGTKVSREWIYKWLKEPRTIVDASGNQVVDGVETEDEPRMPFFKLTETELRGLSAFLISLKSKPVEPYHFDSRVVAALSKKSDLDDQGEIRFRQMFCVTCHSLAVTRGGETKMIGGEIGPELTKVGSKVNPDWLVAWLRDPQAYLPNSKMPRYGWSDEDLYKVTHYIEDKLTDPDLLTNVPKMDAPKPDEIALGRKLFVEKGCRGCHVIQGVPPQKDFGPDLSALGGKNSSQLEFGKSKIPHNLISYIQAKISDPVSVNPAARMPKYHIGPDDLDAITTALLSMTGAPSSPGMAKLVVPAPQKEFNPAGSFGEIYERYKCYVCHKFNGVGGDLAPDLTYEGSRAQRPWLVSFLKNPQTLRPTLTFRMPQFNLSDAEANTVADYFGMALESPAVDSTGVSAKDFTPQMAATGKQLYQVKYQCQACHTIGSTGGYVGPNLNNVGNWMTPAWIEAWLKNPQALVPGSIEPRRALPDDEVKALTAYLLTLRQTTKSPAAGGAAGKGGGR
jgi:cbb3-type cytochrome oxidase cytochrome c subunit